MASLKESQSTRTNSQHRLSGSTTTASSMPARRSASRNHSHSLSTGTLNSAHRVTRRKSMNSSTSTSAVSAISALREIDERGRGVFNRRSLNMRTLGSKGMDPAGCNKDHSPLREIVGSNVDGEANVNGEAAVVEGFLPDEHLGDIPKARVRRASEGSQLTKGDGKRSSGELRCDKCGKGYKHSSCLTKHLWEHTPEWTYTSKLLISKHQQVQLLEAASVLVGMNQDESTISDTAKAVESDTSSASPAASRYSDLRDDDGYSSAETTPPPLNDHFAGFDSAESGRDKRYSSNSSNFSRSYQSAPSSSLSAVGNFGLPQQQRLSTSGHVPATADEEEAGLVAAVESLCSFGTPKSVPVLLPTDIPPVPPLPAQYADLNKHRYSSNLEPISAVKLPNYSLERLSDVRDVKMGNCYVSEVNEDSDSDERLVTYGIGDDDDDDGVFGAMEGVTHDRIYHA